MKRVTLVIGLLLGAGLVTLFFLRPVPQFRPQTIGVLQFVHHPLLDETARGLLDELGALGLNDGRAFRVVTKVADKDPLLCAQIARAFRDDGVALVVAIATPAAQAAAAQLSDVPIVFAAITDPVAAGLADTLDRPGRNLTGTSNRWPFEKQVPLIRQILPTAARVGLLWNPGESNSDAAMRVIRPLMRDARLEIVEAPVASTADVAVAFRTLAEKVDLFFVVPDNTVLAASATLINVAIEKNKPIIGGDKDTVEKGSIATYGYDYFKLGQLTARMVKAILLDAKQPTAMPVQFPSETQLVVNLRAAATFGLTIPEALLARADQTIK